MVFVARRSQRLSLRTHGVRQSARDRCPRRQDPRCVDVFTSSRPSLARAGRRIAPDAPATPRRTHEVGRPKLLYTRTASATTAPCVQAMAPGQDVARTNVHDAPDGRQSRAAQGEHGHVSPRFF